MIKLICSPAITLFTLVSFRRVPSMATASFITPRLRATSAQQKLGRIRLWSVAFCSSSNDGGLFPEELNIIYDSKCNVCKLEMDFLRNRDRRLAEKNRRPPKLKLTNLEDTDYNPQDPANGGVTYEQGMASMHAVTKNGQVINGVPVFRKAYELVNLGWLFAATKIPLVKWIADRAYNLFARYRTNITRGESLDNLIEAYRQKKALEVQKENADCGVCKDEENENAKDIR